MAKCKGCGADMHWATDRDSGARVPLVKKPERTEGDGKHRYSAGFSPVGGEACWHDPNGIYLNHFVDCPNRDSFRRKAC